MKLINKALSAKGLNKEDLSPKFIDEINKLDKMMDKYDELEDAYDEEEEKSEEKEKEIDDLGDYIEEREKALANAIMGIQTQDDDAAPKKKGSGGLLLLGAVVLVVTLGSVNLFKNK
jgi:hypothetical protein